MWTILDRLEGIGVAELNTDGTVLRCNNDYARTLHSSPVSVVGKNLIDLTCHSDRDKLRNFLIAMQSGEINQIRHHKHFIRESGDTVRCFSLIMVVVSGCRKKGNYLLDWSYELGENESDSERVEKLELLLTEVLKIVSNSQGTNVTIKNEVNDNDSVTTTNHADRGSTLSIGSGNSISPAVVAVVVAVCLCAGVVVALAVNGSFSFERDGSEGRTKIEVNEGEQ